MQQKIETISYKATKFKFYTEKHTKFDFTKTFYESFEQGYKKSIFGKIEWEKPTIRTGFFTKRKEKCILDFFNSSDRYFYCDEGIIRDRQSIIKYVQEDFDAEAQVFHYRFFSYC